MSTPRSGGCLCGRVRFAITGPVLESTHCHCSRCRRQHGAAFATYASFDRVHVDITGTLTRYASSDDVSRSFCSTCGSSLLWEHAGLPDVVWIALGTFDDASSIRVDAHIWGDAAVAWGAPPADLPRHPGAFPIRELLALMESRR